MGALPPPNWGKSFRSSNPSQENQLVRVQLPQSTDITLYLQPMRGLDGLPAVVVDYHVTIGTGGIALLNSFVPAPLFGVARHYIADIIEVSVITPGAGVTPRIVAANAAIGRPSKVIEHGGLVGTIGVATPTLAEMASYLTIRPSTHAWVTINPTVPPPARQLFRIPPFATHMQILVRNNTGVLAAEMLVQGVSGTGGVTASQLVGDFATPAPVAPDVCLYLLSNTNAAAHFEALVIFTCEL